MSDSTSHLESYLEVRGYSGRLQRVEGSHPPTQPRLRRSRQPSSALSWVAEIRGQQVDRGVGRWAILGVPSTGGPAR
jgi:hypothetical protein